MDLILRLKRVTDAFKSPPVNARIKSVLRLQEMRHEWERLREDVRELGKQRNEVSHSFISYRARQIVRQTGRPWNEENVVSAADDEALIASVFKVNTEVRCFSTEWAISCLLPTTR